MNNQRERPGADRGRRGDETSARWLSGKVHSRWPGGSWQYAFLAACADSDSSGRRCSWRLSPGMIGYSAPWSAVCFAMIPTILCP